MQSRWKITASLLSEDGADPDTTTDLVRRSLAGRSVASASRRLFGCLDSRPATVHKIRRGNAGVCSNFATVVPTGGLVAEVQ